MIWRRKSTETKAPDATQLHIATAGRAAFNVGPTTYDIGQVSGHELVQRYGMWVARCISLNAQAAASVPFKLMRVEHNQELQKDCIAAGMWKPVTKRTVSYLKGNHGCQPSSSARKASRGNIEDMVEVEQHALLDLLHEANSWTSGCQYRVGLYSDLQIFGRAFDLLIDENRPTEMWSIRPQKCRPIKSATDFVSGFKYGEDPDSVIYTPDEVMWYRQYDPENPWEGRSIVASWLKSIDASFAIQDFQIDLMRRMGSPDWLITKAPMDERQKRAFWTQWQRLYGRMFRRERNIAILDGEAELQRLNDTPRELEYNESAKMKRDEIGQAFGVPSSILDISQIKANNREAKNAHIETTVWPMVQLIEDTWNQKLVPRFGDNLFIIHENPIPDDETIRVAERKSKLETGWTPNEIRIEEGVEPLDEPGADEAYLSNSVVPMRAGTMRLESELALADMDIANAQRGDEPVMEDGPAPDAPADDLSGAPVVQETVLNGAQVTAASAIIQAVVDGNMPIEAARGQLIVMFNLTAEQADLMLAGVEGFEKPEPEPLPMMPPSGAGGEPPSTPSPDERQILIEFINMKRDMNAVMAQMASLQIRHETKHVAQHADVPNVHIYNQLPDHIQEHHPQITNIMVEKPDAPIVNVQASDVKAPDVNVSPPQIYVEQATVDNHIELPEQPAPQVYVEQPEVNVAIPEQPAPVVNINNKQPDLRPQININPEINIQNEVELPARKIDLKRDRDTGRLTGAEVTDA